MVKFETCSLCAFNLQYNKNGEEIVFLCRKYTVAIQVL